MTYQSDPKSSGFRELTPQELESISGGNIFVNMPRGNGGNITVFGSRGGFGFDFGAGGGGMSHDSGGAYDVDYGGQDGLIDDDGDGVIDEIIVTEPLPQSTLDQIHQTATYMQWIINVFAAPAAGEILVSMGLTNAQVATIGAIAGPVASFPDVAQVQYDLIWNWL